MFGTTSPQQQQQSPLNSSNNNSSKTSHMHQNLMLNHHPTNHSPFNINSLGLNHHSSTSSTTPILPPSMPPPFGFDPTRFSMFICVLTSFL